MTIINVLGASSLIGTYFVDTNIDYELVCFSRKNKNNTFLDLQKQETYSNFSCENSFIVSFAPIWLVKDLIIKLEENNLRKLKTLKGVCTIALVCPVPGRGQAGTASTFAVATERTDMAMRQHTLAHR